MASKPQLCRSVLITGANRGIGLQFVKAFLDLSPPLQHVFATCRSLDSATELRQIQSDNSNLHLLKLDVVDSEAVERVVGEVTEKLDGKGLNILLNNAGIIDRGSNIGDITVDSMMKLYRTNAVAPLMLTQAFLALLKKASSDVDNQSLQLKALVLNMSSVMASVEATSNVAGVYSYRASKTALNIINKSLSIDLKSYGIWAVVLHPGWVRTEMGTKHAPVEVDESVAGLMKVISSLDESKNGMFFSYKGDVIPW